jgi:hypothetical protein
MLRAVLEPFAVLAFFRQAQATRAGSHPEPSLISIPARFKPVADEALVLLRDPGV